MAKHKAALAPELTPDEAFLELEEQYGRPLDAGQRLEIGNNLAGFFAILNEWDLKQNSAANDVFQDASDFRIEEAKQKSTCLIPLAVKNKPRKRKPQSRLKKTSLRRTFAKQEELKDD
jgi:hypothetical protein